MAFNVSQQAWIDKALKASTGDLETKRLATRKKKGFNFSTFKGPEEGYGNTKLSYDEGVALAKSGKAPKSLLGQFSAAELKDFGLDEYAKAAESGKGFFGSANKMYGANEVNALKQQEKAKLETAVKKESEARALAGQSFEGARQAAVKASKAPTTKAPGQVPGGVYVPPGKGTNTQVPGGIYVPPGKGSLLNLTAPDKKKKKTLLGE